MSYWTAVLVMGAVGLQLAFQAPVNNRLGAWTGRLAASLISVFVAAVVMLAVCLIAGKLGGLGEIGSAPVWALTGGLIGAAFVAGSTLTVGRLGAGTIAAAIITGQLTSSLLIDDLGWFGLDSTPVTPLRIFGVILLMFGTWLVVRTGPGALEHHRVGGAEALLVVAMIMAGVLVGAQPPINSALADATGGLPAALVNSSIGSFVLLVFVLALGEGSRLGQVRFAPRRYLWGGPIGAVTVTASLLLVGTTGATVLTAAIVTGQLLAAIGLDRFGALGLIRRPLTASRLAGVALLVVGIVLAAG